MHDQVDVFGHEDERPEIDVQADAGRVDRLRQPLAGPLGLHELVSMVAREGQLVRVARIIVVSAVAIFEFIHVLILALRKVSIKRRVERVAGAPLRYATSHPRYAQHLAMPRPNAHSYPSHVWPPA